MNLLAETAPLVDGAVEALFLDGPHRPVEGDPGHHLRMHEMPPLAADLPDAVVGLRPRTLQVAEERLLQRPRMRLPPEAVCARLVERIHHLAVDVDLELLARGVPDPHGRRALVAGQPRQLELREPPLARDAVHDLE